jgi:hypothetical protein
MTRSTNTTRRGFLSTAGAAVAASAVVTVPALAIEADPIFAAIEAHKAAKAVFYSAISDACTLENLLPPELRQSFIDPDQTKIFETDDPRWIKNTRDYHRLSDAETDAACALVGAAPTTIAGVIALLQYANAADTDGYCWPSDLQSDDGKKTRSWQFFLIEMLAEVLPGLAVQS